MPALPPPPPAAASPQGPGAGSRTQASATGMRLQREQLALTCRQARRFPLPVAMVDGFLAWLLWSEGLSAFAVGWFGVRVAMQACTFVAIRALQRRLDAHPLGTPSTPGTPAALAASAPAPVNPAREQRGLMLLFGMMGVSRAVLVPLLFMGELGEHQYLFTMVCMGLSAAGVGNVGGQVRVYLAFALPLGGALALGWLMQGSEVAALVAGLVLVAMAFLVSFVREQSRSMAQVFDLVEEREQLTQELRREHRVAQAALAAKSRFLASASHDLRQPVTTIGLLIGLMSDAAADAAAKTMFSRVSESVAALENLLRGLLDLSRLESGVIVPSLQPVSVAALYASLAPLAEHSARAKGLRLRWRGAGLCVHSDPVLLSQIVSNLVNNAIRYTDCGGVLVSARRRGPGLVRLEVRDTGCGIAADDQQRVFEEFVQLGQAQREGRGGLGLGLAIVQGHAALLGHAVRLQSRVGRGSCFAIDLPTANPADSLTGGALGLPAPGSQTAAPVAALGATTPARDALQGLTLWLLEDEEPVRLALAARLSAWGAQVVAFGRLAELHASLNLRLQAPHGLLTDHRLPDGTGLEAIDAVRASFGLVPALVLTGDTGPDELLWFKARGAAVMHKPFDQDALRACLAAWARLR